MSPLTFIKGLGLGAAAAYFYDPLLGQRRRQAIARRVMDLGHQAEEACTNLSHTVQHRVEDAVGEVKSLANSGVESVHHAGERARSAVGQAGSKLHETTGQFGQQFGFSTENWTPNTKLLVAGAGLGLMANCMLRRTPLSILAGAGGFFLCTQTISGEQVSELLNLAMGQGQSTAGQQRRPSPHRAEQFAMQEAAGMPAGVREVRR
jgi:hypothetical protein